MDLIHAAYEGRVETVRMLLDTPGVNPEQVDDNGDTALTWAIFSGHGAIMRMLLDTPGCNPGKVNINGDTALMWAAWNGHEDIVRMLLATHKSNPGQVNKWGNTALMWAAQEEGHEDVVRMLLNTSESNPGHVNMHGGTALRWAATPLMRRLILGRLVLDALELRRCKQYKVIRIWASLEGLNSPSSNQMFFDMGTQLRQPTTFEDLQGDAPCTRQNHHWYMQGVNK